MEPAFTPDIIESPNDSLAQQASNDYVEDRLREIIERAQKAQEKHKEMKMSDGYIETTLDNEFEQLLSFILSTQKSPRWKDNSSRPKITRSTAFKLLDIERKRARSPSPDPHTLPPPLQSPLKTSRSASPEPPRIPNTVNSSVLNIHSTSPSESKMTSPLSSPREMSPPRGGFHRKTSRFFEEEIALAPVRAEFSLQVEETDQIAVSPDLFKPTIQFSTEDHSKHFSRQISYAGTSSVVSIYIVEETKATHEKAKFSINTNFVLGYSKFYHTEHLNWLCLSHDEKPIDNFLPYFIISVMSKGDTVYFLQQSLLESREWESRPPSYEGSKGKSIYIEKDGKLHKSKIEKSIAQMYPNLSLQRVKTCYDLKNAIENLEAKRATLFKHLNVGILYTNKNKPTIDDLTSIKNKPSSVFYSFLDAMGIYDFFGSVKKVRWCNFRINFLVGPQMDKHEIRQKIGNSMVLIIVHDSVHPFDPSDLFLGQVTNFVCVVKPVPNATAYWRIGFFLHYTSKPKSEAEDKINEAIKSNEANMLRASAGAQIPEDHLFHESVMPDFIMTKLYNSVVAAQLYHPHIQRIFATPIAVLLESIAREFAPDWHAANLKRI